MTILGISAFYHDSAAALVRDGAIVALLPVAEARRRIAARDNVLESPFVDITRLARFAATLDPALYPPDAAYVRDADAKPQHHFAVARSER